MRVAVDYQGETLELDVPDDRLVGAFRGPAGMPSGEVESRIREALEHPLGYPALRQAVVPGDHVVLALDAAVPEAGRALREVVQTLGRAGVEPETIRVVATGPLPGRVADEVPGGLLVTVHDPDDRNTLAYLASTQEGRRVYLNRYLTDADFVLPIGRLGFDAAIGYRGPWSVLFPDLSDKGTRSAFAAMAADDRRGGDSGALGESAEVSWLLGSQFHLAIAPGDEGIAAVVAGHEETVRDEGRRLVDAGWTFRAEQRADLVVAGIGSPGGSSTVADLVAGLATASRLVQHGGKIALLSRVAGPIGPAVGRLIGLDDLRDAPEALRGAETELDYATARGLAKVLAWADVYLLSGLDEEDVEGLSMIALSRPEEVRRLATTASSCLVVGRADQVRAEVVDEEG